MNFTVKNTLPFLIVALTLISVNSWSSLPIGNTVTNWFLYLVIIVLFIKGKKYYYDSSNTKNLLFIRLYLIWVGISFVRGLFVAEYYWDYKALTQSTFALLLPLSLFVLMSPTIVQAILSKWLKVALPLFLVVTLFIQPSTQWYK